MDGQEKTYAENVYAALKANLSPSEFSYANDEKGFYRRLEFDSTYADGVYQTLKNNLSKKDFQFMDNPNGFFEAIHFKKKAQSAPSSTGGTGSDSAAPSTTSGEVPVTPAPKQEKVNYTYQWGTQPATGSDAPQARSKEVIATEQNYNRLTETYADKPYTQADIEDIDFTQYRKEKAAKVNTTINNINAGMPVAAQQISERLNAETEAMPEIQAVKKQLNEAAQQKYNELVKKGVPTGQAKDAVTKEMATAFQNNPVVKEIYGKQTEKLKSEVEAWTKAQVKPETKYFSDKGLEGYKKMTDSDAFKSLSHDEQKTRLAQMWATIENRMRNTKKSQEVIDEAKHDFYYQMLEHVGVNENGTITPFAIKDFAINNLDAARKLEAQKAAEYDSWYNGVTDKTLATQTSLWNQKEDAKKAREILENIVAMPDNENGSLVKGVIDGGKIPFISSFLELNDGLRMYDIAKKQQRGEPLTEAQQGMLNNAALQQTYEAQSTPSTAYQIGKSLSESMAFMGELALTGGAYAVPQKAVAEGLSKVILKKTAQEAEKSAAYQFIIKPLSNVMGAATQTMANQPAILEKMVDRMQPGYIAAMSPEGDKVSATLDWSVQNQETGYNTQAGESFGQAYKQAAASTFSDILSENIFRALPAVMDPVKKRMLQTVTKNSELGKRLFIGWYMTKTGLGLDDVLKRLQARMIPIDGLVEEFAEEFINGSMTNLLTGDARILDGVLKDDNSVDWENIKVTAGSVALMQGLFGLAGKITPKKKVNIPVSDVNGNAHNLKMSANTASYIVQNAANKGYFELLQWAKQNVGRIKQEDREAAQALINGYLSELDSKRVKPFKEAPNVDPAWFKDLNNKYEEHLKNNPTTADDDATEGAGDAAHTVTQTDKPPTAVINIGGEMESVEGEEEIVARVNELKPQIITGEVEITFDNPTQVIKDAMTATPMTDEEVNAAAESLKVDESVTPVKYTEEEANKKLAEINASGKKPKGEELFNFLESLEEGAVVQHEGGDTRTVLGKKSIGKRGGESYELIPQILNEDTGEWEDNPSALTIVSKDKNGEFNVNAALTQDFSPNAYTEIKSGERKISYPKITYPKQTSGTTTAQSEAKPLTSEGAETVVDAPASESKTIDIGGYKFTDTPTMKNAIAENISEDVSSIIQHKIDNGDKFDVFEDVGGGWIKVGEDNFGGIQLYNPTTKNTVLLNHKQGGRTGAILTDFIKNNSIAAKPSAENEGKTSNTSQNEKGSKQAEGRQEGELLKAEPTTENAGAVTPVLSLGHHPLGNSRLGINVYEQENQNGKTGKILSQITIPAKDFYDNPKKGDVPISLSVKEAMPFLLDDISRGKTNATEVKEHLEKAKVDVPKEITNLINKQGGQDAIQEQSPERMGTHPGRNESVGGQSESEGVGAGNGLQTSAETSAPRSAQVHAGEEKEIGQPVIDAFVKMRNDERFKHLQTDAILHMKEVSGGKEISEADFAKAFAESDLSSKQFGKYSKIDAELLPKEESINVKPVEQKITPAKSETTVEKARSLKDIVGSDELRPVMQFVYADAENKQMVATDANKMVIIPDKTIKESELVNPKTGEVAKDVQLRENKKFPNYTAVIPKDNPLKQKINVKEWLAETNGLNRAGKFFDRNIVAHIKIGDVDFYVNPQFLHSVLKVFAEHGVTDTTIELSAPNRAIVIKSDKGVFGLVMPLLNDGYMPYKTIFERDFLPKEKSEIIKAEMESLQDRLKYHQKELESETADYKKEKKKDPEASEWGINYQKARIAEYEKQIAEKKSELNSINEPVKPVSTNKNSDGEYGLSKMKDTPLKKQYLAIKKKYPDAVVLMRVGDFYESMGDDAVILSNSTGVVLSVRDKGKATEVNLAGFPYHVLNEYMPKLIKAGNKVALVEQIEEGAKVKEVKRTINTQPIENPIQESSDIEVVKNNIDNGNITEQQATDFINKPVKRSRKVKQSIEDIERKAESDNETELNEAVEQANGLIEETEKEFKERYVATLKQISPQQPESWYQSQAESAYEKKKGQQTLDDIKTEAKVFYEINKEHFTKNKTLKANAPEEVKEAYNDILSRAAELKSKETPQDDMAFSNLATSGNVTMAQLVGSKQQTNTNAPRTPFIIADEVKNIFAKHGVSVAENNIRKNYEGVYKTLPQKVRLQSINNFFVAMHEITHAIDTRRNLSDKIIASGNAKLIDELKSAYQDLYPAPKKTASRKEQVMEGLAMVMQQLLFDESGTKAAYPETFKEILSNNGSLNDPVLAEVYEDFKELAEKHANAHPEDVIQSRVAWSNMDRKKSYPFWRRLNYQLANNLQTAQMVDKMTGNAMNEKSIMGKWQMLNNIGGISSNWIKSPFAIKGKPQTYKGNGNWGETESGARVEDYMKVLKKMPGDFDANLKSFNNWLIARRLKSEFDKAAELQDLQDSGLTTPEEDALLEKLNEIIRKNEFNENTVNAAYHSLENKFEEVTEIYDAINNDLIDYLEATGLIDSDKAKKFREDKSYASFKRYFEDEMLDDAESIIPSGQRSMVSSLKEYNGSNKRILPPTYNQVLAINEILKKGASNLVWQAWGKASSENNEVAKKLFEPTTEKDSGKNNPDVITVYQDGVKKMYLASPEVQEFAATLSPQQANETIQFIGRMGTNIFRASTTGIYPWFVPINLSVDAYSRFLNTKTGLIPIVHDIPTLGKMMAGVYNTMTSAQNDNVIQQYIAQGASHTLSFKDTQLSPEESTSKLFKPTAGQKAKRIVSGTMDVLQTPTNITEIMGRATEFRRAIDQGLPTDVAMYLASEVSLNFSRRGNMGGAMGQEFVRWIPYMNASVQGLYKFLHTAKESPAKTALAIAGGVAIASSLAMLMLSGGDDDDKQFLMNQPVEELGRWIYIPMSIFGGSGVFKLRIPEQVGTFTGAAYMYLLHQFGGRNWHENDKVTMGLNALPNQARINEPGQMLGSWIPQTIKPSVEVLMNKKFYPHIMPILGDYDLEKMPKNRYDKYSSEFAKDFGAALNWSPKLIDHYVRAQFGRSASMGIGYADYARTGKENKSYNPVMQEYDRFMFSGMMTNNFYDLFETQSQIFNDLNKSDSDNTDKEKERNVYFKMKQDKFQLKRLRDQENLSDDDKKWVYETLYGYYNEGAEYALKK